VLAQEFAQEFGLRIMGALIQANQDGQSVPRLPDFQCARVVFLIKRIAIAAT